jgi:hypothetical protein
LPIVGYAVCLYNLAVPVTAALQRNRGRFFGRVFSPPEGCFTR